jgi:hypothetical protein
MELLVKYEGCDEGDLGFKAGNEKNTREWKCGNVVRKINRLAFD